MKKILQSEENFLRQIAQEVKPEEFGSPGLLNDIRDMENALAECSDGVALAAPQIGIKKRIFIVSKKLLLENAEHDMVFINPKIIKRSKKTLEMEEGCLSVRWYYGEVKRSITATVSACDAYGKKFTKTGHDLWAQIFQHEIDHLDGILFIDKAKNLREILPEQNED